MDRQLIMSEDVVFDNKTGLLRVRERGKEREHLKDILTDNKPQNTTKHNRHRQTHTVQSGKECLLSLKDLESPRSASLSLLSSVPGEILERERDLLSHTNIVDFVLVVSDGSSDLTNERLLAENLKILLFSCPKASRMFQTSQKSQSHPIIIRQEDMGEGRERWNILH